MEKEVRFSDWNELKKAIPGYEKLGYRCEVRGWKGMKHNILTITDEIEEGSNE